MLVCLRGQPAAVICKGPLEAGVIRMEQLAAQPVRFLIECHIMAPFGTGNGTLHTGRAAAHNGDLLLPLHRGDHLIQLEFDADPGIYGTEGPELIAVIGHMALVAPDAGIDIFTPSLIDLFPVLTVTDPGAGHADDVRLVFPEDHLIEIRILQSGRDAHTDRSAPGHDTLLQGCGSLQIGAGNSPGGGEADGMLGVLVPVAHMQDIDFPLQKPCQFKGIPAADAETVHGDQHFQREVSAECLLHGIRHFDHESGAVIHTPAVFIGAVVCVGGPEFRHHAVVIGVVEGEHLKAKLFEDLCIGYGGVNIFLDLPPGDVSHIPAAALFLFLPELLNGIRRHWSGAPAVLGCSALASDGKRRALSALTVLPGIAAHRLGDGNRFIVADGIDGLAQVVVGTGLRDIDRRVMGRKAHLNLTGIHGRASRTLFGAHGEVQINRRRAVFRTVGKVGDQPVCWVLLRSLKHMRNPRRGNHAVFQKHIADLKGTEQLFIAIGHRIFLLSVFRT